VSNLCQIRLKTIQAVNKFRDNKYGVGSIRKEEGLEYYYYYFRLLDR